MTSRVQTLRSSVAGHRPAASSREPGELFVNFADRQLGFVDTSKSPVDLLPVRIFKIGACYKANEMATYDGVMYRAANDMAAAAQTPDTDTVNWQAIAGSITHPALPDPAPGYLRNDGHGAMDWHALGVADVVGLQTALDAKEDNLPADASGFLANNGSGTLGWTAIQASQVSYNNSASGLNGEHVQSAIDWLSYYVDELEKNAVVKNPAAGNSQVIVAGANSDIPLTVNGQGQPSVPLFAAKFGNKTAFTVERDRTIVSGDTGIQTVFLSVSALDIPDGRSAVTAISRNQDYVQLWGRPNASYIIILREAGDGSADVFRYTVSGQTRFRIGNSGDVWGTGPYNNLSDVRTKENIVDLPEDVLSTINDLRPRRFSRIGETQTEVGFIAQEIEAVIPEAVTPFETGPMPHELDEMADAPAPVTDPLLAVAEGALIPYLVRAVQNLTTWCNQLQSEITALREGSAINAQQEPATSTPDASGGP